MLRQLELKERELIQNEDVYKAWMKKAKNEFYRFVHELELERRRNKENLEINSLDKAEKNFNDLWNEQNSFDITVQKRLKMIKGHWKNLIMFHQLLPSSMKRAGIFNELKPRLLELFMAFIPFINY
jgi:hypothetical protein